MESAVLPNIDAWPDLPVLHLGRPTPDTFFLVPFGQVVPFETELFQGSILARLKTTPGAEQYFAGKRRVSSTVIQGRFKQALPFSDVVMGQQFDKPVSRPSPWIVRAGLAVMRTLAPTLEVQLDNNSAHFVSPLVALAQTIHIAADNEPVPALHVGMDFEENVKHLGGKFAHKTTTFSQRKSHYHTSKNLTPQPMAQQGGDCPAAFEFSPEFTYTFDFYQDLFSPNTFVFRILGMNFEVQRLIGQQPLLTMAKSKRLQKDLWRFEYWHVKQFQQHKPST
eukprot:c17656_g1_i3.p1 GENE.c17656_g1_i3~~c17656_g1_i3.p1  ORF type:complete len:279 (-),score=65.53 c17656_g1_i3:518-1354(-)